MSFKTRVFIGKFFIEPCKQDTCLVKAACTYVKIYPWLRAAKCPDYKRYKVIYNRINTIMEWITSIFWGIICIIIIIFIIASFLIGAWDIIKTIYYWF